MRNRAGPETNDRDHQKSYQGDRYINQNALDGKLDVRGNAGTFNGAYREIVSGVNKTLDAIMGPINEASAILQKVANKDMSARITGDYKGDYAKIKEALNLAVENLDKALQQVAIGRGSR